MNINLLPVTQDPEQFASWAAENFRRIIDGFANVLDTRHGTSTVTGSLTVATGLTTVEFVTASFFGDPPSNDTLVAVGRPSPTSGSVLLKVFGWGTPTLVPSTTAINVNWIAFGF